MTLKLPTNRVFGLALGLTGVILAVPMWAGALAQDPTPATPPAQPDLQKQIDDALKELDKLDKINPEQPEKAKQQIEDVRQQMRQRLFQGINGNGAIFINPGFNGVRRPLGQSRLGIAFQKPPMVLHEQLKLPANQGLIVMNVIPESAAAKAGIQQYDILVEWDGKPVPSDVLLFQREVLEAKAGVELNAAVLRQGQKQPIKGIKLADVRPEPNGLAAPNFPGFIPPNIQIVPPGGFGGLGGGIQLQAVGNGFESMRVQVMNDNFTVQFTSAEIMATVKGSRENGKATPSEITIRDGETNVTARTLEEVPERYRATIDRMLDRVK